MFAQHAVEGPERLLLVLGQEIPGLVGGDYESPNDGGLDTGARVGRIGAYFIVLGVVPGLDRGLSQREAIDKLAFEHGSAGIGRLALAMRLAIDPLTLIAAAIPPSLAAAAVRLAFLPFPLITGLVDQLFDPVAITVAVLEIALILGPVGVRSEERRVGKECRL